VIESVFNSAELIHEIDTYSSLSFTSSSTGCLENEMNTYNTRYKQQQNRDKSKSQTKNTKAKNIVYTRTQTQTTIFGLVTNLKVYIVL